MTTTTEDLQRRLYPARQTPELIDVPELSFLMLDGHGDPTSLTATARGFRRCTGSPTRSSSPSSVPAVPTIESACSRGCGGSKT